MPPNYRTKRACDRCNSVKERCRWTATSLTCERCCRLNYDCQTQRPLQKAGRKSRGAALKSSIRGKYISDLEVDSISTYTSSTPSDYSSRSRSPEILPFVTDEIPESVPIFTNINPVEDGLLQLCLGNQASVGRFTIGPSFHKPHQQAFLTHLLAAPQLKDAFLSCAAILAGDQNIQLSEKLSSLCKRRAAVAVSSLRSLRISYRQDISICLILGMCMTTFALYVAGGEALVICRYALSIAKPAYESNVALDQDEISFLVCLVLTETVECLLQGGMPTLRMREEDLENNVDRFLGICTPLLTHLYDICSLNDELRQRNQQNITRLMTELDCEEKEVEEWTSTPPAYFPSKFEKSEVMSILAQAKILRLTILLVIHRMRCPYNIRDEKSRSLSNAIFDEIDTTMQVIGKSIKCIDLGLMVASFELVDEIEQREAFRKLDAFVKYSPQFRSKLKSDLTSFWEGKKRSKGIYWYDVNQYLCSRIDT